MKAEIWVGGQGFVGSPMSETQLPPILYLTVLDIWPPLWPKMAAPALDTNSAFQFSVSYG